VYNKGVNYLNLELAKKIKQLRTNKAFSQEELAERTQLSLRTIQRIEGGETEPRGDTLKRLANALDVTPNDLIQWIEQEDRGFLTFLNLSVLSFVIFPLLGLIVPIALWVLKRDKIKSVDEIGKRIINFQITWCVVLGLWYISFISVMIFNVDLHLPNFGLKSLAVKASGTGIVELLVIAIPILLYKYNFCLIIYNTVRSYNSKTTFYKPAIRFLK
jgi:transcriptional regulator with XRE-family HTH domain